MGGVKYFQKKFVPCLRSIITVCVSWDLVHIFLTDFVRVTKG